MQFKENLCFFERGPLPDDLMQALTLTYEQPDPYLITPVLWPAHVESYANWSICWKYIKKQL